MNSVFVIKIFKQFCVSTNIIILHNLIIILLSLITLMFSNAILVMLLIFSAQTIAVVSDVRDGPSIDYPIRSGYIDKVLSWWPPASIAAGLGVPGYAAPHLYNYLILAFWSCSSGNLDMVNVWGNPVYYFGNDT